jgi:hypothetical protein
MPCFLSSTLLVLRALRFHSSVTNHHTCPLITASACIHLFTPRLDHCHHLQLAHGHLPVPSEVDCLGWSQGRRVRLELQEGVSSECDLAMHSVYNPEYVCH